MTKEEKDERGRRRVTSKVTTGHIIIKNTVSYYDCSMTHEIISIFHAESNGELYFTIRGHLNKMS